VFLTLVLGLQDLPLLVLPLRAARQLQHGFYEFRCQQLLYQGVQDRHTQISNPLVVPLPNVVSGPHSYQLQ